MDHLPRAGLVLLGAAGSLRRYVFRDRLISSDAYSRASFSSCFVLVLLLRRRESRDLGFEIVL